MKTPVSNPRRRRGGFTLVELMVAMGITTIIVGVLVTITGVATDTWTRSRSEIRASRQAKAMIDTMAKDFESMVSRRGNNFEWLRAEMTNESNFPKVTRGQSGGGDVAQVTFLTAATDRYLGQVGDPQFDKGGDVSCVSYRLKFQDPIEGGTSGRDSTFVLYRSLVDPDKTFEDLLGKEDLDQAFSSYENNVDDQENFICENVHQFTLTFHVEVTKPAATGSGSTVETVRVAMTSDNSSGRFSITGNGMETNLDTDGATIEEIQAGRLTAVEISISVISDAGIARIEATGNGLDEKDYARQVYHYSRIVEVPGI